jgi:hypothetical protein
MDVNELTERYPRLFHLAEAGSAWAISTQGLLPARETVSTSALDPDEQAATLSRPRPRTLSIEHPLLGRATLRDQTPLRGHILDKVLTDMTAQQWLSALNERVFFWLHPQRLDQLLNARRNRDRPHDILVIDTASLVGAHDRRIQLSAINSGAALYPNAPQRGTRTFQTIEDYPFAERLRRRTPQAALPPTQLLDCGWPGNSHRHRPASPLVAANRRDGRDPTPGRARRDLTDLTAATPLRHARHPRPGRLRPTDHPGSWPQAGTALCASRSVGMCCSRNRMCGPGSGRMAYLPSLLPGVARTLTVGRGRDRCTGRGGSTRTKRVPSQR